MRRRSPLGREDQELLSSLVYLHYERGIELARIASEHLLPLSRSKAHELLRLAKSEELIKTFVDFVPDPQEQLAVRVQSRWAEVGVRKVLIMPSPAKDHDLDTSSYRAYIRSAIGTFAARYVSGLTIPENAHVCIDGGRAMLSLVHHLKPKHARFVVRPLSICGRWRDITHLDAVAVIQNLHARFREQGITVVCPDALPGDVSRKWNRPEIRAVFGEEAPQPFLMVTPLGRRRYVPNDMERTSTYVKMVAHDLVYRRHFAEKEKKHLGAEDLRLIYGPLTDEHYAAADEYLKRKRVVAEISRCAMNSLGQSVDTFLEHSTFSIKLDRMRAWRDAGTESILVVSGSRLTAATKAALLGGYVSTLIIDTALAVQLLDPSERPELYQKITEPKEDESARPELTERARRRRAS